MISKKSCLKNAHTHEFDWDIADTPLLHSSTFLKNLKMWLQKTATHPASAFSKEYYRVKSIINDSFMCQPQKVLTEIGTRQGLALSG
jgi:hypothetical protein